MSSVREGVWFATMVPMVIVAAFAWFAPIVAASITIGAHGVLAGLAVLIGGWAVAGTYCVAVTVVLDKISDWSFR